MSFGFDEQTAVKFIQSMDDEQIKKAVEGLVNNFIVSHLDEVRERAQQEQNRKIVRKKFEDMPEDDKAQAHFQAVREIAKAAVSLRESPSEGAQHLKTLLRDPYTAEALLLIYDDAGIGGTKRNEMKEYTTHVGRFLAASIMPEMYEAEEVRESLESLGVDEEVIEEALSKAR